MSGRDLIFCLFLCIGMVWCADSNGTSAPPSIEEQKAALSATRDAALKFEDKLPDFICTQVSRRWVGQLKTKSVVDYDPTSLTPAQVKSVYNDMDWKLKDTLTVQVSSFHQQEQYTLMLVNGKRTKRTYESIGGATVYGDFSSVLGVVFQASSHTQFDWDHWALLGGQRVMVFHFRVQPANSQWQVSYESQRVTTGFDGSVFIDPRQNQVLKLQVNADAIPKGFPITKSGVELDYRPQPVGGAEYLLPLRADEWNETKSLSTRNEVEFSRYRKFSADSKLDFETPAPVPADQIKEVVPK